VRRILWAIAALAAIGLAGYWFVTRPAGLAAGAMDGLAPADPARGELVFWAAGCASCHAAEGAKDAALLELGGGRRFPSPFGTFVAPNISPDPDHGIGGWTALDLARAMTLGVSPDGRHYFPAFPYTSYARAGLQDIADLHAFLMTLPPVATPSQPHEVPFPFGIRRNLGVWKALYLDPSWVLDGDLTAEEMRGRYLVEALGHCGECHTPRDALGGPDRARWLAGGPVPGGEGRFPNITPAKLTWSEDEIVEYLTTGFTPDFDSAGGHMALVVGNLARLPAADRTAIARYLGRVPAAE